MESLRKHIVICVLLSIASLALFAQEPLNKKKTIKVNNPLKACRSGVFSVFSHPKTEDN